MDNTLQTEPPQQILSPEPGWILYCTLLEQLEQQPILHWQDSICIHTLLNQDQLPICQRINGRDTAPDRTIPIAEAQINTLPSDVLSINKDVISFSYFRDENRGVVLSSTRGVNTPDAPIGIYTRQRTLPEEIENLFYNEKKQLTLDQYIKEECIDTVQCEKNDNTRNIINENTIAQSNRVNVVNEADFWLKLIEKRLQHVYGIDIQQLFTDEHAHYTELRDAVLKLKATLHNSEIEGYRNPENNVIERRYNYRVIEHNGMAFFINADGILIDHAFSQTSEDDNSTQEFVNTLQRVLNGETVVTVMSYGGSSIGSNVGREDNPEERYYASVTKLNELGEIEALYLESESHINLEYYLQAQNDGDQSVDGEEVDTQTVIQPALFFSLIIPVDILNSPNQAENPDSLWQEPLPRTPLMNLSSNLLYTPQAVPGTNNQFLGIQNIRPLQSSDQKLTQPYPVSLQIEHLDTRPIPKTHVPPDTSIVPHPTTPRDNIDQENEVTKAKGNHPTIPSYTNPTTKKDKRPPKLTIVVTPQEPPTSPSKPPYLQLELPPPTDLEAPQTKKQWSNAQSQQVEVTVPHPHTTPLRSIYQKREGGHETAVLSGDLITQQGNTTPLATEQRQKGRQNTHVQRTWQHQKSGSKVIGTKCRPNNIWGTGCVPSQKTSSREGIQKVHHTNPVSTVIKNLRLRAISKQPQSTSPRQTVSQRHAIYNRLTGSNAQTRIHTSHRQIITHIVKKYATVDQEATQTQAIHNLGYSDETNLRLTKLFHLYNITPQQIHSGVVIQLQGTVDDAKRKLLIKQLKKLGVTMSQEENSIFLYKKIPADVVA